MSQTFNVVKCFQCLVYQVDIDKKSTNKWSCKLCGAKQTLKQVFFQGDSKDCRQRVMALNELKGKQNQEIGEKKLNTFQEQAEVPSYSYNNESQKPFVSKWARFLTKEEDSDNET